MNRLEQAQELFRLQALARQLIKETSDALITALAEPGSGELLIEAERKLAELQLVQNEFKTKVESWQTI